MKKYSFLVFLLFILCLLVACNNNETNPSTQLNTPASTEPSSIFDMVVTNNSTETSENESRSDEDKDDVSTTYASTTEDNGPNESTSTSQETSRSESDSDSKLRDNTPICLTPSADGITIYSTNVSTLDVSNANEGYVVASYYGDSSKVKFRITGSDNITYTYDLHGGEEVFPLSAGSGNYDLAIYEVIQNSQYATAQFETIAATITNTFGPFLYPNQYIMFDSNSNCVSKAEELVVSAESDLDAVALIYNYIIDNITYDYDKAANVQSGYLPYPDDLLDSKTGICLDYASLMVAMLRSQRIPARLEIGYVGEAYHAWISTYISDIGWINGIIEFDGENWKLMDPTFAASVPGEDLENFIGDGSSYLTKYIY
jgi:transglutaminase-like putative cysteine protease